MSRNYKIGDQRSLHFVTFSVINWIDVFTRNDYKDILLNSIRFCQKHKGLNIYAWCIMTNHIHLIIGSQQEKIEDIARDLKKFTSKKIVGAIQNNEQESRKHWMLWMFEKQGEFNKNNTNYQFWQQHYHPIELNTNQLMEQKLEYIHQNPVKAGFVYDPEHYVYSSAIDYAGGKGLLDVQWIS